MHPYFLNVKALFIAAEGALALLLKEKDRLIQPHLQTDFNIKLVMGWQSTNGQLPVPESIVI